ncbi:Methyltransferase [Desulfosporosinus sp. BG]|nr:Methyltransferase [Desulfosporosinus sp. BG]
MDYFSKGKELACYHCGKKETGNICCSNGHYVCDDCHGKGCFEIVRDYVLKSRTANPLEIAEILMGYKDKVPMLGCENAWVAAGALISAIRNEGSYTVTDDQVVEVLNRTKQQAIGGYCGLTGVCGIAPAIGACFSVVLNAACPKDQETAQTMRVVAKIVSVIASETGPCCCKNFVRQSLQEATYLVKEILNVALENNQQQLSCTDIERHPHGCRKEKCVYFKEK